MWVANFSHLCLKKLPVRVCPCVRNKAHELIGDHNCVKKCMAQIDSKSAQMRVLIVHSIRPTNTSLFLASTEKTEK